MFCNFLGCSEKGKQTSFSCLRNQPHTFRCNQSALLQCAPCCCVLIESGILKQKKKITCQLCCTFCTVQEIRVAFNNLFMHCTGFITTRHGKIFISLQAWQNFPPRTPTGHISLMYFFIFSLQIKKFPAMSSPSCLR